MSTPLPDLPYQGTVTEGGRWEEDATQFDVSVDNQVYLVSASSNMTPQSDGDKGERMVFHALEMFDPSYESGFWAPAEDRYSGGNKFIRNYSGGTYTRDSSGNQHRGEYFQIKLPNTQTLGRYVIEHRPQASPHKGAFKSLGVPVRWTVLGSNDGATWEVVHDVVHPWNSWRTMAANKDSPEARTGQIVKDVRYESPQVPGANSYEFYRFVVKDTSSPKGFRIDRVQMFMGGGGGGAEITPQGGATVQEVETNPDTEVYDVQPRTPSPGSDDGAAKFLGLAWYWWVAIGGGVLVVIIIAVVMYLSSKSGGSQDNMML